MRLGVISSVIHGQISGGREAGPLLIMFYSDNGCPFPLIVRNFKNLFLTISDDLKWNQYVNNIVKKANKRIYFIIQLNPTVRDTALLLYLYIQ
jgi:hypothetical protein